MSEPIDEHLEGAREVARRLRGAHFEAYFAGGCVRDTLRGEHPKDYDVVTDARPEEVAKIFRRTVLVGASFGVVRVNIQKGCDYEVATFRKDSTYSDGRHPDEVEYSKSKEEDVQRRDFTINALLMDPFTGEVIDLVGGREDLARGVIRAVGDPFGRIAEDKLRMLRAVRFASRFGFEIESQTLEAIKTVASHILQVSSERIVIELEGIFLSKDPVRGLDLLVETDLWRHVLAFSSMPFARSAFAGLPGAPKEMRARIAWALLLEGTADPEAIMRELKLSRSDMRTIERLLKRRPLLLAPAEHPEHERVRLLLDEDRELFLAYASVLNAPLEAWREVEDDLSKRPLPKLPLVTGNDLEALGVPKGPIYKELLSGVEAEIFERRITTKDAALDWIRAHV